MPKKHSAASTRQQKAQPNICDIQPGEIHAFKLCDDSLAGKGFENGTVLYATNGDDPQQGELTVYLVKGEQSPRVRFMYRGPGGWLRLQAADRDEWPDVIYKPDEVAIIGPLRATP